MSSEVKILDLTCDSCSGTAKNIPEAIAHATANIGHELAGAGPLEDSTVRIIAEPVDAQDGEDEDGAEDDHPYDDDYDGDLGDDEWVDQ